MNRTLVETIEDCQPYVKNALKLLFFRFGNLKNILADEEASTLYCKLMVHVIVQRERELGFWEEEYWGRVTKSRTFEEIRKQYQGTIVMPF